MHWNVPPDALPGSATFVLFWTAGLTTVQLLLQVENHIFLGLGAKSAFSSVTSTAKQHFH